MEYIRGSADGRSLTEIRKGCQIHGDINSILQSLMKEGLIRREKGPNPNDYICGRRTVWLYFAEESE